MALIYDPILGDMRSDATTGPAMTAALVAATTAQRLDFSASALPQVATLADLLAIASPAAGWRAVVVAPVIVGGTGYTRWVHDGAGWRLDGPQDLIVDTTPASAPGGGTAEQIIKSFELAPGLLSRLRYARVQCIAAKSGSAETGSVRVRIGATGTTADTQVGQASYAAANRQLTLCHEGFASGATQWRAKVNGFVSPVSGGYGTSSIYPINCVIPATSGALRLSLSASMSATVEVPSIVDLIVQAG